MVWAEMMSMNQPSEYKKEGVYSRDNYDSSCGYAQELFDSDESIYEVEIYTYTNPYYNGDPIIVETHRDIYPPHYFTGEHIEHCDICGAEVTVPARKHGDRSKYLCCSCFNDESYDGVLFDEVDLFW